MPNDFRQRIYKLKVTIVALVSLGTGIGLQVIASYADRTPELEWVGFWQLGSIGGTLFAAGLFGIVWDYFDGKDKEAREDERIRRLLKESAPAFRDAVVRGFGVESDDLKRVATPELLDSIAMNALALRLNDRDFAREIYQEVRDQVIHASERWYDADVSIRLSSLPAPAAAGPARFEVTIQWEYTLTPTTPIRKFACTSDREEFHDLISDIPATSTWFMTPRPGFDASDRDAFELLQFSVDGEDRAIRRSRRKAGQTYSVSIGDDVVHAARPVRIRHVYRTITAQSGHLLTVALSQPTRGLKLSMDYTNTTIASMRVSDLVSSARRPRVSRLPQRTHGNELTIDVDGWLLPQAEVSFVWTLASESESGSATTPSAAADSSVAV